MAEQVVHMVVAEELDIGVTLHMVVQAVIPEVEVVVAEEVLEVILATAELGTVAVVTVLVIVAPVVEVAQVDIILVMVLVQVEVVV
jgi:hypothetical protein